MASGAAMGGLDYAGNIASFNTNRADSQYNSWMNNYASLNAANMQSSAAGNAGTMGMLGSIGSAALGGAVQGFMVGGPWGAAAGAGLGGASGALAGGTMGKTPDSWFPGY
jgi:hypothetical protein